MARFKVGIIGCGRSGSGARKPGQGLSHNHARGYESSEHADIVAAADIVPEYADAYAKQHDVPRTYTDYREMLDKEELDIVSIITWPHLHAEMTVAAAESGAKAVHCEKPMAVTYGDAKRMVDACQKQGCQLTIGHQRRFRGAFRKARELVRNGAIGELTDIESRCPNLYDWGTHWFDISFFLNDEQPVESVMGQVDTRNAKQIFGAWVESQGLSHFTFENGVTGMLITGSNCWERPSNTLRGTDGVIEVAGADGGNLRVLGPRTTGWQEIDVTGDDDAVPPFSAAIHDLIDALLNNRKPELAGDNALRATELIFATYESSRRRARVDLPLDFDDNPLLDLLNETGEADEA